MKYIGVHVSISGGIEKSVQRANDLSATAYALFLKNQRQWQAKPYTLENIENYKKFNKENNFNYNQILPMQDI